MAGDFNWKIWWTKLGKNIALLTGATISLYAADYIFRKYSNCEHLWSQLLALVSAVSIYGLRTVAHISL